MNRIGLRWTALCSALALSLGGCASLAIVPEIKAETPSLQSVLGDGPQAYLLRSFRKADMGGTLPAGSSWYSYYAPASAFTQHTTACLMQELRVSLDGPRQGPSRLAVLNSARFLFKNDGSNPGAISETEATQRCNDQPVNYGWFGIDDKETLESVFAAWSASGALHAIASGQNNYAGIDLTSFANQPSPTKGEKGTFIVGFAASIRDFAKDSSDDVSSVTIRRLDRGNIEGVVTFGMHPTAGCYLNVKVVYRDKISADRTRSERRITSIDVSKVSCYVV